MWDCLVSLSIWIESNSGQIQIFIALVALVLAIIVYGKVKDQIDIANSQTEISLDQNTIAAKIKIQSLINENLKNNIDMLKQLPLLINEFQSIKKQLQDKGEFEKSENLTNTLTMLNNQKNKIIGSKETLISLSSKFTGASDRTTDELNSDLNVLYENLISSTSTVGDYHLLVHNIEQIKIEEKLN